MSNDENVAKPPYVSWGTFEPIFKRLKSRAPTTVTLDVLKRWEVTKSNAQKALPALRFLGIIDSDGEPNQQLWQSLTASDPAKYKVAVRDMMETAYERLLSEYSNAFEADDNLLGGYLSEIYGTAPQSRGPSVAFIRGLMKEAGMLQKDPDGKAPRTIAKKPAAKQTANKPEREKIKVKVDSDSANSAGNEEPGQRVIHIHIHVGSDVEKIGDVIKAVMDGVDGATKEH